MEIKKLHTDDVCDRIVRSLASGALPKRPPMQVLVEHLIKRKRIAYSQNLDLWIGKLSNGRGMVLVSLISVGE